MCVGSTQSDPKSNVALTKKVGADARTHRDVILPHERAELDQLNNERYQKSRGELLAGRSVADAAAYEKENLDATLRAASRSGVGLNRGVTQAAVYEGVRTGQKGRGEGSVAGYTTATGLTQSDRFGALATGEGHSRSATSGLSSLATNDSRAQASKARADQQESEALGNLVMTAGVLGHQEYKRAGNMDIPEDRLSPIGKVIAGFRRPESPTSLTPPNPYPNNPAPPTYGAYDPYAQLGNQYTSAANLEPQPAPSSSGGFKGFIKSVF